jgi:flavin-dependent dehydrogenase
MLKPYYERLLTYLGVKYAAVDRYSGHHLALRRPGSTIVKGPALLLGDAAGLVDPFTGEGLLGAVRSGQLAAEPVVSALAGRPGGLWRYQALIDSELMTEFIEARIILRVFDRIPGICHAMIGFRNVFWRNLVRLMVGESDYRGLGGGTYRHAWRAADRLLSLAPGLI